MRRQVHEGGCGTGTMSYVSGKAMDRFRCTWIAMIGELYELIAEYLGNGLNKNLLAILKNVHLIRFLQTQFISRIFNRVRGDLYRIVLIAFVVYYRVLN